MQKLCCVRTRQHSLPVWIISSQVHHRISTNSQPFSVGIVSKTFQFLGNIWRDVAHLSFPFVFSSWAFGQICQDLDGKCQKGHQWCQTVCTPSIGTADQIDQGQSASWLSGRCAVVASEISPWLRRGSRGRFHPLVSRECW